MKFVVAILLTSLGTLTAQDTPKLFKEANETYETAKLRQVEKEFSQAARLFVAAKDLFQKFIIENPDHLETPTAYYRSGVSDLLTGKRASAEEAFRDALTASNQKGQSAASAAYRLGALAYNDDEFADAAPYFTISKNETDKPTLKAQSLNYLARCSLFTEKTEEAQTALEELVAFDHEENDFKAQALLALAHLHATKGEPKQASQYYLAVPFPKKVTSVNLKDHTVAAGEAGLKLISELAKENPEEAESLKNWSIDILQKGLESNITGRQKLQAQFYLMDHFASQDDHAQVLATFRMGPFSEGKTSGPTYIHTVEAPQDLTAKVLLLAAKSSLAKEHLEEAKEFSIGVAGATKDKTLLTEASELKEKIQEELKVRDQ